MKELARCIRMSYRNDAYVVAREVRGLGNSR